MRRDDPLRNFRFRLEMDGVTHGAFSEVAIGDGGMDLHPVRRLPGLTKYANVSLKRGVTDSNMLREWHRDVLAVGVADSRRTVRIVVVDEAGADRASFLVREAWPTKYDPSDLDAKGNELFIELLELANEGIERSE